MISDKRSCRYKTVLNESLYVVNKLYFYFSKDKEHVLQTLVGDTYRL